MPTFSVSPFPSAVKWAATAMLLLGAAHAAPAAASADVVSGPATVLDSDDIEVAGKRIMLYGLESVQRQQFCQINGEPWQCHAAAVRQLETLTDVGEVSCTIEGRPDVYGRLLGRCEVAGRSLNEAYVRSGYAVARRDETKDYIAAEEAARKEKAGLWKGDFMTPWDYRTSRGIMVDRP